MSKLYSYCIINDHGAAPNPFWGVCTLAICKLVIRRTAQIGDWIAATGSARHGIENQLVYAMKVSSILTLKEYDSYCKTSLHKKIPVYKQLICDLKSVIAFMIILRKENHLSEQAFIKKKIERLTWEARMCCSQIIFIILAPNRFLYQRIYFLLFSKGKGINQLLTILM